MRGGPAFLLATGSIAAAAGLLYLGARLSPASLAANLLSDVLVASVPTVALKVWLVLRARQAYFTEFTEALNIGLTWIRPRYERLHQLQAAAAACATWRRPVPFGRHARNRRIDLPLAYCVPEAGVQQGVRNGGRG